MLWVLEGWILFVTEKESVVGVDVTIFIGEGEGWKDNRISVIKSTYSENISSCVIVETNQTSSPIWCSNNSTSKTTVSP